MNPAFNDPNGIGKAFATTFLSAHIGWTFHPTRPEEERIDMPKKQFDELANLAQQYLESIK